MPPVPPATPATRLSHVTIGGSLRTKTSKLRVFFRLSRAVPVRFTIAKEGL